MPTPKQQNADPYAQIAKPVDSADPYASIAAPVTDSQPAAAPPKGMLDRLADWGEKTFASTPSRFSPEHPATSASDAAEQFLQPGGNIINAGIRTLTKIPAGVAHSAAGLLDPDNWTPRGHQNEQRQQVEQARANGTGGTLAPGQKPGMPTADQLQTALEDKGGELGAGLLVGHGVGKLLKIPGVMKDIVRGDVDAPMVGDTMSPRQRYEAANRLGVKLDAADATNSTVLGKVKQMGEHSLLGGHLYDASKAANRAALTGSMDDFLEGLYPGDRESGGRVIQDALKTDHAGLRTGAETGFDQLTEQTKGKPVVGAPSVGKSASTLLKTIEPLSKKYPSLAPGKTLSVLHDLSNVGAKPGPLPRTGFLDAPDSEFAAPPAPAPPVAPDTWSDLQRLRSATHDLTTTNPDLVKSEAIAPLQQMTHSLDDAMTNGSSGLTPAQAEIFRDANSKWKDMKSTYDDNSSPYFHAVRNDSPSELSAGVGEKTPENARNLLQRLTPSGSPAHSPAVGALRRGTVESALKPTAEGIPNFKNFPLQLNRIPADYRAEIFSPGQNETLRDFTSTSNVLGKDFNPSGSGKHTQKFLEAAALGGGLFHPTAAIEPLMQYPLAKIITSPAATEWLMKPGMQPHPLLAPLAGAAGYETQKQNPGR